MRAVFISDTHGQHNNVHLPEADIVFFSGDACERGTLKEWESFCRWYGRQQPTHKVLIAGNHDRCAQEEPKRTREVTEEFGLHYLRDEEIVIEGLRIYGYPWQPWFHNWAFNLQRAGQGMQVVVDQIPDGLDVLLTHGPPHGVLDRTFRGDLVGCELLDERLWDMHLRGVAPRVHCFGHIHEGYGQITIPSRTTTFLNASQCGLRNGIINPPIALEI